MISKKDIDHAKLLLESDGFPDRAFDYLAEKGLDPEQIQMLLSEPTNSLLVLLASPLDGLRLVVNNYIHDDKRYKIGNTIYVGPVEYRRVQDEARRK